MKIKVVVKRRWAIAKVGSPSVLPGMIYDSKEQAERNLSQRKDLEVREIIG